MHVRVSLNEDAIDSLRRMLTWRAQPAVASEKEMRRQLEEQRSYAVEVVDAILREHPDLGTNLLEGASSSR